MAEMSRSARAPNIGPEYGNFLYATIGVDGTSLLSAMARMNIDPWQEAVVLSELPSKAAASRLTALIAAIPGTPPPEEPGLIAARLIKLLPQRTHLSVPQENRLRLLLDRLKVLAPSRGVSPLNGAARPRPALHVLLLLIVLALTAEWYVSSRTHSDKPSAPAASAQSGPTR
jgi:hypothetical protein